jgi:hypothetical protein
MEMDTGPVLGSGSSKTNNATKDVNSKLYVLYLLIHRYLFAQYLKHKSIPVSSTAVRSDLPLVH